MNILDSILTHKIVAIVRRVGPDAILPTAQALYDGGVRLLEVTIDQNKRDGGAETAAMIRALIERFGNDMHIGAGTVLSPAQVDAVVDAGAGYVISPNVNLDVIRRTVKRGALSIPGALTPTEIVAAHDAGAQVVKLFPAGEMGVAYVKAVCAPLSHIPLLAVGGISPDNMGDFLGAGAKGFGIGSNIVNTALIKDGRWAELTALARRYTDQISG